MIVLLKALLIALTPVAIILILRWVWILITVDYLIPEYEDRIIRIRKLQCMVGNPPIDRPRSVQAELYEELNSLQDKKLEKYLALKRILERGWCPVVVNGKIGYFKGEYSSRGSPYVQFGIPGITEYSSEETVYDFEEITSRKFMYSMMR